MFRAVDFLHVFVKLDGLTTLGFSAGAGLIFFVWPLCGLLLGVLLYYFTLLIGVSGSVQQERFSRTGHLLSQRDCIFCLALDR